MSTGYNSGSHCENHQRSVESLNGAAPANVVAYDGNRDHLMGYDQPYAATSGHGMGTFGNDEIAAHSVRLGDDAGIALDGEMPNATQYERNFEFSHRHLASCI